MISRSHVSTQPITELLIYCLQLRLTNLSFNGQHFDLEQQSRFWWDTPRREPTGAIPLVRRDLELPDFSDPSSQAALVPPRDDAPTPALYVNGEFLSLVDQNFLPVSSTMPVACTVTRSLVATIAAPAGADLIIV
eukprot:CAMPEP_0181201004 /NCGR_PEP_ID=MMETSP1096-20121128/18075_1 /TAXON_ID=156174 ORGANISM="Chrysochromulina ericina, Strain CCMP281" /NCGR_SAMPLE_ID=MMETSP1096 /ASSEMBLY_ACC=CAM_ASM_000453 /LENGTH=134 /DNA_ID=CAMNT_0023291417 /DNA_START=204 /DNA_END=609 /DNA_ORIENTATION=+